MASKSSHFCWKYYITINSALCRNPWRLLSIWLFNWTIDPDWAALVCQRWSLNIPHNKDTTVNFTDDMSPIYRLAIFILLVMVCVSVHYWLLNRRTKHMTNNKTSQTKKSPWWLLVSMATRLQAGLLSVSSSAYSDASQYWRVWQASTTFCNFAKSMAASAQNLQPLQQLTTSCLVCDAKEHFQLKAYFHPWWSVWAYLEST